nr:response regulator [Lelliottia steviae]
MVDTNILERQLMRERKARKAAEKLLEEKALELHNANQELVRIAEGLDNLVQERTKELSVAVEKAETANKVKSVFLANISHEFRTPMNAILGLTHILLNSRLGELEKRTVEKVHNSAQSLMNIINDILDFSKIENGQLELQIVPFNLETLIQDLANSVYSYSHQKKLNLSFYVDPKIPPRLEGDSVRISHVLLNLINNAIKFTEHGSVNIKVETISNSLNAVVLKFSVVDTGIGISEQECNRLFKSFSQIDESLTRKHGGTGLGLAISKSLVDLMKGKIDFTSKKNEGSEFNFTVPLKVMESQSVIQTFDEKRALVFSADKSFIFLLDGLLSELKINVSVVSPLDKYDISRIQTYDYIFSNYHEARESISKDLELINSLFSGVILLATYDESILIDELVDLNLKNFYILSRPILLCKLSFFLAKVNTSNHKPPELSKTENNLKGRVALIVEDNPVNLLVISNFLNKLQVNIETADNGEVAVKKARIRKFDFILMDCQMPVMDGFKAAKTIRTFDQVVPIIAMTASDNKVDLTKAFDCGMNEYISKPFDFDLIENKLTHEITLPEISHHQNSENSCLPLNLKKPLNFLNVEKGIKQVGDNPITYLQLLKQFLKSNTGIEETVSKYITSNNKEAIARLCHTSKGLLATIGATELSHELMYCEQQLMDCKKLDEIQPIVESNLSKLRKLIYEVEEVIELNQFESDFTTEAVTMESLRELIASYDAEAPEAISAIISNTDSPELIIGLKSVREYLYCYDYESALLTLDEMSNRHDQHK